VVALAAPSVGHAHDHDDHGHGDAAHAPATVADGDPAQRADVTPTAGTPWFDRAGAAEAMRARMTGAIGAAPIDTVETTDHAHGDDAPPHGH
jgi:hypothetical protein